MRFCLRLIAAFLMCCIIFFSFQIPQSVAVSYGSEVSSKLFNFYLKYEITSAEATSLAKWDVLVLDMEVQYRNPDLLKKIRSLNPDIVLLVYITPQEIRTDASTCYSVMRQRLAQRLTTQQYLTDHVGKKLSWWSGTYLLNISNNISVSGGKRVNQIIPEFLNSEVFSSGLWDGVFYDNAWDNISYFVGSTDVDYNQDGIIDVSVDQKWREGMQTLYTYTRQLLGPSKIIVGNNDTTAYLGQLNGMLIENFNKKQWPDAMQRYKQFNDTAQNLPSRLNLINVNTSNTGKSNDYQLVRFGLSSTLLESGYFSFDHGDQDHGQLWWYDEYSVNLGKAVASSVSKNNYSAYKPDVWSRQFENGIALVNSTDQKQTVQLDGEYEKIHGTQDTGVNDGSIVSELTVGSKDGMLLLKTFETLQDIIFTNGAFMRFFRPDSSRVRNGFFVFDQAYTGGTQIAHLDLDGNGKQELIVIKRNKIEAWRDDGVKYMRVYPFGGNYTGTLKVAIGDLDQNGKKELYVAPSEGMAGPIKIYSRYGLTWHEDFYPFGKDYTGGYSLAVGDVDGGLNTELIVGRGGNKTEIAIFASNYQQKYVWKPFESSFTGGANVAVGDLNADHIDEILVGRRKGKPEIKVFSANGTLLHKQFMAYDSFGNPGIDVRALDVDFDGKDDIVGMSEDAF